MSQVTGALSIYDGLATPVARSFAPERVSPDLSTFCERTASTSNGFKRLSVSFSPATTKRSTNRTVVSLALPVVESVSGVNQVTRTLRFEGTFIVPDNATAAERADLRAFAANALDNALIEAVIKDLDPLY